ncbi:Vicianin hydrolase (Fragment) [Linum perenne]
MKMAFVIVLAVLSAAAALFADAGAAPQQRHHITMSFNRSSFPKDFVFGAGTASYQSEGAAHMDGKGQNVWDNFTREHKDKIWDHSNGDVADDFYHRYAEDIKLMKKMGLDSFRFSISWARILPKGKLSGGVNPKGLKFYNRLIDDLLANGIKPFVTLFHWDLPNALSDDYSGFLSSNVVDDFREYADLCFKEFGDRVKHWCTLNEPYTYSVNGYNGGTMAPGRCSRYIGNCTVGNSATEPYIVAHNLLLSHAAAVRLYKAKYQATQKGEIGITIVTNWFIPKSPKSVADKQAAQRAVDFMFGWFAHPVTYGDYPENMKKFVGHRLPRFSKEQSKMLAGSLDFMGVNYYTTNFASDNPVLHGPNTSYSLDSQVVFASTYIFIDYCVILQTGLNWLFIYPRGIHSLMLYVRDKYKNPPIYITENGN